MTHLYFYLAFCMVSLCFQIKLKFAIVFYDQINRYLAISFLDEQQQKLIFQFYNEQPKKAFNSLNRYPQIYIPGTYYINTIYIYACNAYIYINFTASCINVFKNSYSLHTR